ncbi:hypothetical protein GCM10022243_37220 [Saccharothrix violaceirubra]|uniref:Uncharacterized protein n=1 Tax=Saccharothrix violaceirubra TaxID=413306 RepID=A0A7W7WX88_9PSEU|nr:hypothetical protein [Saccharothrix violaceirubra]MBB4966363.1 hypothetical protein [Saccharothrix violaceirubra]
MNSVLAIPTSVCAAIGDTTPIRHEVVGDEVRIAFGRNEIDLVLSPRAAHELATRCTIALDILAAPEPDQDVPA